MRKLLLLLPLIFLTTFCNFGPAQPDVASIVSATLTAAAGPQAGTGSGGSISGRLFYPADSLPPLRVVAFLVGSDQYYSVDSVAGQSEYRIDNLPEGKYHVVAYTIGAEGTLSGAYTQAVMCGMTEACTDHNLVDVVVFAGETSADINIADWLQPNLPPMPGGPAASGAAVAAEPGFGAISGNLAFPSSGIPAMRVVAFNLETAETFAVETAENQTTYQLDNLPAGRYYVVAYATGGGIAGGYTAAVPCGLTADCADHTLLEVNVVANSITQNILPGDFYAPEGTFPPPP